MRNLDSKKNHKGDTMRKFIVFAVHVNDCGEKYFEKFYAEAAYAAEAVEIVKELTQELGFNFQYFIAHEGEIV
jgi:hypothetical protein